MDDLKNRTKVYIRESGVPLSKLAEKLEISRSYLYKWLKTDIIISARAADRIDVYLRHFNH